MDNWFTVEKIDDKTFAISEYGHWEKVHSYLLLGTKYALLIDTGLGIGNIKKEVDKLTSLPVKVVTTHAHWDHIGGHKYFENIYVHQDDENWLRNGLPIPAEVIKNSIMKEPFTKNPPEDFDINRYKIFSEASMDLGGPRGSGHFIRNLKDNDILDLGDRKIRIIHTPGHSPGHICLLDEQGQVFTGDLIYSGTLYAFYPSTDPVKFKESIDKISRLNNITRILPGHNDIDIPLDIIERIKNAFTLIENKNLLKQGSGIFSFEDFKIQI